MDARELEAYLHDRIPLSRAMAIAVVEAGPERVRLAAPLAPNINHRDTVFGGSAASLAMAAIANQGVLVKPWLVRRVVDPGSGEVLAQYLPSACWPM